MQSYIHPDAHITHLSLPASVRLPQEGGRHPATSFDELERVQFCIKQLKL